VRRLVADAAVLSVLVLSLASITIASAASPQPPGSQGYDISWPQCGGPYPSEPLGFAIIGVNDGRSFTQNSCFASQYRWAWGGAHPPLLLMPNRYAPSLYINTDAPAPGYTRSDCAPADLSCIYYRYGRDAAAYAVQYAQSQGATVTSYWLDVEPDNYWTPDTHLNAIVLSGMIAELQSRGMTVGIYSTSYMFRMIAGDYMPGLPVWVPGIAHGPAEGPSACTSAPAFGGGKVAMVQWTTVYDASYVCP
jgi:hypothetical protein